MDDPSDRYAETFNCGCEWHAGQLFPCEKHLKVLKLYRVSNENATCGFEVNSKGIVVNAAPIIRKTVLGLSLADAIYALTKRGWEIEA